MSCLNTKAHSESKHQWSHLPSSHIYLLDSSQYSSYTLQVKLAFTLLGGFMIQLKDKRFYETTYMVYYLLYYTTILSTILYYYMISYTLFIHYRTRNPGCVQVFSASWTQKTVLCYREWFESPQVIFFFKWRFPPCIGLRRALTFCCNYVYIQSVTKKSHDGSKWEDRLQNWSYVEDKFED